MVVMVMVMVFAHRSLLRVKGFVEFLPYRVSDCIIRLSASQQVKIFLKAHDIVKHFLVCLLFILTACGASATPTQPSPGPTYDPRLPFPIPAACWQPTYTDAAKINAPLRDMTPYWFGNEPLALGRSGGPVWYSGANPVVWWSSQGEPTVEVRLLEGKSDPATLQMQNAQGPLYRATITFPKVGCWEIITTVKEQTLRVQVYLYSTRYNQ
jgi:hypothetical protein